MVLTTTRKKEEKSPQTTLAGDAGSVSELVTLTQTASWMLPVVAVILLSPFLSLLVATKLKHTHSNT